MLVEQAFGRIKSYIKRGFENQEREPIPDVNCIGFVYNTLGITDEEIPIQTGCIQDHFTYFNEVEEEEYADAVSIVSMTPDRVRKGVVWHMAVVDKTDPLFFFERHDWGQPIRRVQMDKVWEGYERDNRGMVYLKLRLDAMAQPKPLNWYPSRR